MLRAAILTFALAFDVGVSPLSAAVGVVIAAPGVATSAAPLRRVEFRGEPASLQAQEAAEWAVRSNDHKTRPFIVIDKVSAKLFAFGANGVLIRATPVLLGMGIGDSFAPGVMAMDMNATQPWQRITPGGRFESENGENLAGERVLWIHYDGGIAIHKLPAQKTRQRRQERLASPTPADNRITFGCINVPPSFYDEVIQRYFASDGSIVYVLPERASAKGQSR